MNLLFLLLIPIVVYGVAFVFTPSTVTWKEVLVSLAATCVLIVIGWHVAKSNALESKEHWNGRISAKVHDSQGCCHCHQECRSRDSDGHCTMWVTECAHSRDYYWDLQTNIGKTITIESCEPNPRRVPQVWEQAKVGEPVAVENIYTNYLLADKESLMTPAAESYLDNVLPFPEIHTFYKVDRVISDGPSIPSGWQDQLDEMNADLGPRYQIDLLVYLTEEDSPDFADAVKAKWLYGPKNAVTVILGVEGDTIKWSRVVTLSQVEQLKIEIRDSLPGKQLADPEILSFIRNEVKTQYHRTPMAEYDYLATAVQPTTRQLVVLFILDFLLTLAIAFLMHVYDFFGDEGFNPYRRRYRY